MAMARAHRAVLLGPEVWQLGTLALIVAGLGRGQGPRHTPRQGTPESPSADQLAIASPMSWHVQSHLHPRHLVRDWRHAR